MNRRLPTVCAALLATLAVASAPAAAAQQTHEGRQQRADPIATASVLPAEADEVPNDPGPITGQPGPPGGWVSKQ